MLFKQISHANARGTYFESKHVQPSSIDIIIIIIINIFNNPNLENSLLNIYLKSNLTNATASYTAKMGGGRKILPTPSLVKIHNRIKRYIWKDKQANIIFGLIVCYIDIGGGKEGKEGRGLVLLQVQFIPFGPWSVVSLYYCRYNFLYRVDVPFVETTLSSSLFPLSLGEGETSRSYTLVDSWHAGEGEEGKKRPCKDDFSSLAFVPPGEGTPPTLSTTSYLSNDLEILAEPSPVFLPPRYKYRITFVPGDPPLIRVGKTRILPSWSGEKTSDYRRWPSVAVGAAIFASILEFIQFGQDEIFFLSLLYKVDWLKGRIKI